MINSYSTKEISTFIGVKRRAINYYIREGHLEAVKIKGRYRITQKNYFTFRDEYFDANIRNSSRGPFKKLTEDLVNCISLIIKEIQNNDISYDDFIDKHQNKKSYIPNFKEYIIFKRDMYIKHENRDKGFRQEQLADIYGLSVRTIQQIVKI